jgi:DNA-binding LacI/PurR family transcriptional regulator
LGAIRTLLTNGVRIPEDIAVVGFDDIEAGRYNTPTLTTISPDKTTIAQLAVDRLIARLDNQDDSAPAELWAPYELMVRESTVTPAPAEVLATAPAISPEASPA